MLTAVSKNTNFDETNWKKKVRYVGSTELNKAIDVVNEKINTINNITIPGINNKFNEFIEDGVLDSSEKARLTDLLNQASNEVAAVIDQVNNIITSKYLTNNNANKGKLKEANTVMKTAWTEYKNLINTLIDADTEITKVNIGEANTKYRNLQEKIKVVKQYLAICQADILSGMGTDITSYKYLKDALNQTTEISGGLVLTSAIQLKDVTKKVTAGMNGIVKGDKTSIAAWYGGPMVDRDTFTSKELETKVPGTDYAMSLFRHDGTGYLAGGNIHWNANGVLSGNFNSFILQGTSMVTMFYYIRLFYLHTANQDTTNFNNIDYVTPMKTFSRLSVLPLGGVEGGNNLPTGLFIGDSNTGGSFQIGNIILRTKSGDPNILEIVSASSNKTAHLGVQGGVSAYGTYTPSTGGGNGLNGTIIPYSTAIASDPQNEESKIASASSIYKLHSRISAIENNGATSITVTGTGNAITSVSKNGTSITFTKGATFLTSHQSLANYYTKGQVNNIANDKSSTSHTHSVTINGVTKTIAATGGTAVDLGTYLTSHQSLANYVTINDSRLSDSRYPKFANKTWYLVGDNVYIGDNNIGGTFCIKSANNVNASGIAIYNSDETKVAKLWFDNTNINLDKQLVMNNKRIWIQGVGTAGGNNNRLTLVAGTPSELAFNTSCRGTILYSNGIAFADPYNSKSNTDSGWIRHLETTSNVGTLEIAVGDDASNEQIHFRWYNTNSSAETIAHDITVPRATGTLALTSQIPTTLPANGGNSDTVDGFHANGLLSDISNSDKGISITVGGTTKTVGNLSVNYASTAANSDTVDGFHANGLLSDISNSDKGISITVGGTTKTVGNLSVNYASTAANSDTVDGFHANGLLSDISNSDKGISITVGGTTRSVSNISVNYASTAGNANAVDGEHLIKNGSGTGIKQVYYFSKQGNNSSYIKLGTLNTVSVTNLGTSKVMFTVKGGIGFGGTNESVYEVAASTRGRIQVTSTLVRGNRELKFGYVSTSSNVEIWMAYDGVYRGVTEVEVSSSANFTLTMTETTTKPSGFVEGSYRILAATVDNVASATKLQTPRTIWGQKFDGTNNIGGTILPSATHTYNLGSTTYVFEKTYTTYVDTDNTHDLRLSCTGVEVLRLAAADKSANINYNANISGNLSVNGLISNKGILPTNREVNDKGPVCYVWADALCSEITAITDSIQVNQVTVQYSNDNGNSWTKYPMEDYTKFNLYANNAGNSKIYLGNNVITGNNDAEKLAQIKKNQLMFTFNVPNDCYSQVYFASVNMSNGVYTICTVDILNNSGAVVETYTKRMTGWNQVNYINLSANDNTPYGVGNDSRRYIRFKFKHDQNTTVLRNAQIYKIRIFAFTKYSFPTDRFMGHTGHIYNFDYNMNTYFPNSILAKGGVTAYQSSDVRLKTNITKLNCLKVIKSIGGTYEFDYICDNKHSIGFIAQNVNNPLLKDIVAKDDNGYLKINYWNPKLISLAFGALTEIDDEVDKLKARVRELESEVEYLKNKDYALQ
jgi:hypothetical protein